MTGAPDWQRITSPFTSEGLANFSFALPAGNGLEEDFPNLVHNFAGFVLAIAPGPGSTNDRAALRIIRADGYPLTQWQSFRVPDNPAPNLLGRQGFSLSFPLPTAPGDQLKLDMWAIQTCTFQVEVTGVASMPPGVAMLRPDGRLSVAGYEATELVKNAPGTYHVIPAQGLGLHILLKALFLVDDNSPAASNIFATIRGNYLSLIAAQGATPTASAPDFGQGLLLDANTPLDLIILAGAADVGITAIYDVVL